ALGKPPCLPFPGQEEPDYAAFVYFAYIIGTSGQTADVSFGGAKVRRGGLGDCVPGFFYNAGGYGGEGYIPSRFIWSFFP
ncbi:hypothetical protein PL75_11360, partial [Neisseria arctica]